MRVVGLKTLKNKLSEYVRIAASGERVLVTDRDQVVAELVPPSYGTAEHGPDAVLAEAVRRGWIRPPVQPQKGVPPSFPCMTFDEMMRELDEMRADRV
jgi:prevent-host-death family protein